MTIRDNLRRALAESKLLYEESKHGDSDAKINEIRTGDVIQPIHEWCKRELVARGVASSRIQEDFKASGFFKTKQQDVSVLCGDRTCQLHRKLPPLSINVRSQFSSIQKTYDTLSERLIAEVLNLHLQDPLHVAGFFYVLPLWGYDQAAFKKRIVALTESYQRSKYLRSFSRADRREGPRDKEWKYERLCLALADFSQDPPEMIIDRFPGGLPSELFPGTSEPEDTQCLRYEGFFDELLTATKTRIKPSCVGAPDPQLRIGIT